MQLLRWAMLLAGCLPVGAQIKLQAVPGKDASWSAPHKAGYSPLKELRLNMRARLREAAAGQRGELWLVVGAENAEAPSPTHLQLRIPLSSTEDAYGESRSCAVEKDGSLTLTFTAGLEEKNFVRFAKADAPQEFSFLLNKYLCRALAAPFHCSGGPVSLPKNWARWRLGTATRLALSSAAASAAGVSAPEIRETGKAFDPAACAEIAPSDGVCCVEGNTTQWHCGGTPAGSGWHQVSGDCFHRETGGRCKQ